MNCPKCKQEISEKDLVCPNCKKVLKLKCQKCGHITKKAVCDRCGNTIINKCYKCGRLNSTSLEICPSCGMNIDASILLREATIEEFAAMTIELENYEAIQEAFNSEKLARHFRANFYALIKKIGAEKKLRVQLVDNVFIIRFCKDYSFLESCLSAVDFSIFVAQSVTEINKKLYEAKGITVKAKIAIQKRDVFSKPSEYKAGVNINLVYSSKKMDHLFNNVQVLVDSYIYQVTKNKYPYQSLSAVYIKNQMVMFFELILPSLIKIEEEEVVEGNFVEIPKKLEFEPDETEDEQLINFSSLHCSFLKAKYDTLLDEIARIVNNDSIKNPIIAVKSTLRAGNLSGLYVKDFEKAFNNSCRVCRFSCDNNAIYTPLGFLKGLLYSYTNATESDVLLHPECVDAITRDTYLQNLLLLKYPENRHPEDVRYEYFESFAGFFKNISEKTVFIVDNFENIDEGSLEILKYLIENNILGNASFIFSYCQEYSLHRKIYKLITSSNFFEIELRLSSNRTIINNHAASLKNIEKTFFFEKVIENTKGSNFFYNQAINYLLDNGILEYKDGQYCVHKNKMIVIPGSLEELAKKRIQSLGGTKNLMELYVQMLMLGEKIPVEVVSLLGYEDVLKLVKRLVEIKLIQIQNDRTVYITNYNLYKQAMTAALDSEKLQECALNLLQKIISYIPIETKLKAEVYELAGNKKEAFAHWNKIAEISNYFGDFNAYLNCTNKYLSFADNIIDEESNKTVEQVKMEVYEEMSLMLYKYYPEKILNFLELLLENLELSGDDLKIKTVANKLVQSCLLSGNYANALEYVGKIISRTRTSSFNPHDGNFNLNYFLINMVTLELYYNLGRLNECVELGDELFKHINISNFADSILPQGFSRKQFQDAIADALFFVSLSRIIQLKPDAAKKISEIIPAVANRYACFDLLLVLQKFLTGQNIAPELNKFENRDFSQDKYSQILYPILRGMIALRLRDWDSLGDYIYQAKLVSNSYCLHQIEHFCDLMIGFAYQNMDNLKKAKQIYYSVLDSSSAKAIKNITYLCWYLIAQAERLEGNNDTAMGILNNALLNIEKDENVSPYFIMMFKTMYAELLLANHEVEKALFCANQSFEIISKHHLGLNLSHISNMLTEIYKWLMGNEKDPHAVEFYKKKLMQVAATNMQT